MKSPEDKKLEERSICMCVDVRQESTKMGRELKKYEGPGEFAGGPVVRAWFFHFAGLGSIPSPETKIPQV